MKEPFYQPIELFQSPKPHQPLNRCHLMSRVKQKGPRTTLTPTEPDVGLETLLERVKELADSIDHYLEQYPADGEAKNPPAPLQKLQRTPQGTENDSLRREPSVEAIQSQTTSPLNLQGPKMNSTRPLPTNSSENLQDTAGRSPQRPQPAAHQDDTKNNDSDFLNADFIAL